MSDISQSNDLNIHDILIELSNKVSDDVVAVAASAGIDSWSVVFSLLEIGKKVNLYSFTLDDRESYDFSFCKSMAKKYDLKFIPVYLPTNIDILKTDILFLAKQFSCKKKVEFECLWPFLYLYKTVTERTVGSGLCADGYFCISKSGMIHYKDRIDEFRQNYFSNNGSQYSHHYKMAEYYSKDLFMPYRSEEIFNYFIGKTWDECNKPRQKWPIYNSFLKEFSDNEFKPHSNLQLGDSGISKHFEKLLYTDWNLHKYKSVVGIYNCINNGELPNAKRKLI